MFRIGWIGSGFVGQVAHLTNYVEIPEVEIICLMVKKIECDLINYEYRKP